MEKRAGKWRNLGEQCRVKLDHERGPSFLGNTIIHMVENQESSLFPANQGLVGETLEKGTQVSQKH